jgi:hypothetical protein
MTAFAFVRGVGRFVEVHMNGLNTQPLLLSFAAATVAVTLDPVASVAQEISTVLSAKALAEIVQVEAEIDRLEVQHRYPCQSAASILYGKSSRSAGISRQSSRIVLCRRRRRQFSD